MPSRVYRPVERPPVEVLVEDTWHPGELRAWQRREGAWWANVSWSPTPGMTYLDVVPAERVRPVDEVQHADPVS